MTEKYLVFCKKCNKKTEHYKSSHDCVICMKKRKKEKDVYIRSFVLNCGVVEGALWKIRCVVHGNGSFREKSRIDLKTLEQRKKQPIYKRQRKKKHTKRYRELGFIRICLMPEKGDWIWHHVDKEHMVPVVRYIHEAISHKHGDGKLEGILG